LMLMILAIAAALLAERQVSFGLDSNKDLFAFLGLVVNYRWIADSLPQFVKGAETASLESTRAQRVF